jgi:hypothetical protein
MKRATVLLAASLLGTACYSRSGPGDLTFFWAFADGFNRSSGNVGDNNGCGVAGVDSVDIAIDGKTYTNNCTGPNAAGITLLDFVPGSYAFSATGFRGNEQVFAATGTAVAVSGANSSVDVVLQALNPQSFVVFYSVNGLGQCNFFGLVYRLVDSAGRIVSTTEVVPGQSAQQSPIACDPVSLRFTIPNLPFGTYRFDYLVAVSSTQQPLSQVCSKTVAHGGFPDLENLKDVSAQNPSCL